MTDENRRKMFLARAKHAEEQANKVKDHDNRLHWLKIAEACRQLAKYGLRLTERINLVYSSDR